MGALSLVPDIPVETFLAVRRIYNIQHIYIKIGDQLDEIFSTINLALLDPSSRGTAGNVFRFALVIAFQYAEFLSDASASEATFRRLDWKYALHMPVNYPGIPAQTLCEFRQRLCSSEPAQEEFAKLLIRLGELGLFTSRSQPEMDPLLVINLVCRVNRVSQIRQAMKNAIGSLASVAPDWLRAHALPHWYERYKSERNHPGSKTGLVEPEIEAALIGADIANLLSAMQDNELIAPKFFPEIVYLQRLFIEQYQVDGQQIRWRGSGCLECTCGQARGLDH